MESEDESVDEPSLDLLDSDEVDEDDSLNQRYTLSRTRNNYIISKYIFYNLKEKPTSFGSYAWRTFASRDANESRHPSISSSSRWISSSVRA